MSDASHHTSFMKSVLLVMVFVLASLSPMLMVQQPPNEQLEAIKVARNSPFSLASGYGHDIAGTTVSIDGLDNAVVREESMFDYWISTELNNSSVEHHGTPDMELTRHDMEHYCWSTEEGLFVQQPTAPTANGHPRLSIP